MIEFKCPVCGKFLRLPHSYAGKTTECPGCLKTTRVPGAPAASTPAGPPKSSQPAMQLCVECGGSFPTGQLHMHTGQLVCTECFHKRKPVELRYPRKRSRKRKVVLWLLIAAAIAAAALAVWYFAMR